MGECDFQDPPGGGIPVSALRGEPSRPGLFPGRETGPKEAA